MLKNKGILSGIMLKEEPRFKKTNAIRIHLEII